MKTEEEIREKIEFLRNDLKRTEKEYINSGEMFLEFYKGKKFAIDYFTAALEWVLEDKESEQS